MSVELPSAGNVFVFGPPGTGKTRLLKQILSKKYPLGLWVEATVQQPTFIPPQFHYQDYQPQILDNVLQRQQALYRLGRGQNFVYVLKNERIKRHQWGGPLLKLIDTGRSLGILSIFAFYYQWGKHIPLEEIPPIVAKKTNYVFVYPPTDPAHKTLLYTRFFEFMIFEDFLDLIDIFNGWFLLDCRTKLIYQWTIRE